LNGEIGIYDSIQNYFSDNINLPTLNEKHIQLYHLANHTSSLPREPNNIKNNNEETIFEDYSIEDFKSFINDYELSREIGSEYEYSNIGAGLLGYILKENQNKSYYQMIKDEILLPLGMSSTNTTIESSGTGNYTQGYVGNEKKPELQFSEMFEGAGVLTSNMSDMMKFLELQIVGNNSELIQAIELTHVKTADTDEGDSIGLGWMLNDLNDGQDVVWHNGGTIAYSSFIGFNKSTGKGVVILMNSRNMYHNGEITMGFEILRTLNRY